MKEAWMDSENPHGAGSAIVLIFAVLLAAAVLLHNHRPIPGVDYPVGFIQPGATYEVHDNVCLYPAGGSRTCVFRLADCQPGYHVVRARCVRN